MNHLGISSLIKQAAVFQDLRAYIHVDNDDLSDNL